MSTLFEFLAIFCSIKIQPKNSTLEKSVRISANEFASQAVVEEAIQGPDKKGRVYFDSTWWPAKCDRPVVLLPGQRVRVIGIDQITLIVEPLSQP